MRVFAVWLAMCGLFAAGMMVSAIVFIVLHIDWLMEV